MGAICNDAPAYSSVKNYFPEDSFYNYLISGIKIEDDFIKDDSMNNMIQNLFVLKAKDKASLNAQQSMVNEV